METLWLKSCEIVTRTLRLLVSFLTFVDMDREAMKDLVESVMLGWTELNTDGWGDDEWFMYQLVVANFRAEEAKLVEYGPDAKKPVVKPPREATAEEIAMAEENQNLRRERTYMSSEDSRTRKTSIPIPTEAELEAMIE